MDQNVHSSRPSQNNKTPNQKLSVHDEPGSYNRTRGTREKFYEIKKNEILEEPTGSFDIKERRLDEQFKTLLERCNRSKEYIDGLKRNLSQEKSRETILSPPSSTIQNKFGGLQSGGSTRAYSGLDDARSQGTSLFHTGRNDTVEEIARYEEEINDLKNVLFQNQRAREDEYRHRDKKTKFDLTLDSEEEEAPRRTKDDRVTHSRATHQKKPSIRSTISPTSRSITSPKMKSILSPKTTSRQLSLKKTAHDREERKKAEKAVEELNHTIQEREHAQHEKYINLKIKCRELKDLLRECISRNMELEETNRKKDITIFEHEEQIRRDHEEILRSVNIIQEIRKREENLTRSEEEARSSSNTYFQRVQEQRLTLQKIEDTIRENEERYRNQLERLVDEGAHLKAEVEILRERENTANGRCEILIAELEKARNEIDSRDRNAVRVEEQLGIRESEARTLADQIEKLTTQNKNLLQRLESANNAIAATEVKLTHESKRHEDERSRMLDEKQKELLQKGDKIKQLKAEMIQIESDLSERTEDLKLSMLEIERLREDKEKYIQEIESLRNSLDISHQDNMQLRAQVESLQAQNSEVFNNFQNEADKASSSHSELKKYMKLNKHAEERIAIKQKEVENLEETNRKLNAELRILQEENKKSLMLAEKYEFQSKQLSKKQEEEINKIEAKVDIFAEEIRLTKQENGSLKAKCDELTKLLERALEERDVLKQDLKTQKHVNMTLEAELQEQYNQKIKEIYYERMQEIELQNKEAAHQQHVQSKLKAIEEIQDLIRSHRMGTKSSSKNDRDLH